MNDLVQKITILKQEFVKKYTGNAHIQEILPLNSSDSFQIDSEHLKKLHEFAKKKIPSIIIIMNKKFQTFLALFMGETLTNIG